MAGVSASLIADAEFQRSSGVLARARVIVAAMSAGDFGALGTHVGRRLGQMELEHDRLVSVDERRLARQALEEHAPERVEIATVIDLLESGDLLRAHVGRGADGNPRAREAILPRRRNRPSDTEVEQHGPMRRENDVLRLDVAVDEAAFVRMLERAQQLPRQLDHL